MPLVDIEACGDDDSSKNTLCLFYVAVCSKKCWPRSSFIKETCVDMKRMGVCISLLDVDSNVGVCLIKGGIPIYVFSIGTSYTL